jgi:hypothetical protein
MKVAATIAPALHRSVLMGLKFRMNVLPLKLFPTIEAVCRDLLYR